MGAPARGHPPTDRDGGQDRGPSRSTRRPSESDRQRLRPGCLDLVHGVLGALTGDPVGRLLPERTPSRPRPASGPSRRSGTRPSGPAGSCRQLVDRVCQVGRQSRPLFALTQPPYGGSRPGPQVRPVRRGQVGLEGLDLGPVGEGERRTRRRPRIGLLVVVLGREVEREDVAVRATRRCPSGQLAA